MYVNSLIAVVLAASQFWLFCASDSGTASSRPDVPASQPAVPKLEITMLGPIAEVHGHPWPRFEDGTPFTAAGVMEPRDVTVHLGGGRSLQMQGDPIILMSTVNGFVTDVHLPSAIGITSLRQNVDELRRVLARWGVEPNGQMTERLENWWQRNQLARKDVIVPDYTAATPIDDRRGIFVRMIHVGTREGWRMVIIIEATVEEREKLRAVKKTCAS